MYSPTKSTFDTTNIAGGINYACGAVFGEESNVLYCWGANGSGQLGDPAFTSNYSTTPRSVTTILRNFTTGSDFACFAMQYPPYTTRCWGRNYYGQLGRNTTSNTETTPTSLYKLWSDQIDFPVLTAGDDHVCGVASDSRMYCWGRNNYGKLGMNANPDTVTQRSITTLVNAPDDNASVAWGKATAGVNNTCALTTAGIAYCWGSGANGAIGNGATALYYQKAQRVSGANTYAAISGRGATTCASLSSGSIQCWGANDKGQLGSSSIATTFVNVPTTTVTDVNQFVTSVDFACAVRNDDEIWCWGSNANGALGQPESVTVSADPVAVANVRDLTWSGLGVGVYATYGSQYLA